MAHKLLAAGNANGIDVVASDAVPRLESESRGDGDVRGAVTRVALECGRQRAPGFSELGGEPCRIGIPAKCAQEAELAFEYLRWAFVSLRGQGRCRYGTFAGAALVQPFYHAAAGFREFQQPRAERATEI